MGDDYTICPWPRLTRVVEQTDDKLVVIQDTCLAWPITCLIPVCIPAIWCCLPQLRWTFDRKANSIVKEQRHFPFCCVESMWQPLGKWQLSPYRVANFSVQTRISHTRSGGSSGRSHRRQVQNTVIVYMTGNAGVEPIPLTNQDCCGSWVEYDADCCCCCHPSVGPVVNAVARACSCPPSILPSLSPLPACAPLNVHTNSIDIVLLSSSSLPVLLPSFWPWMFFPACAHLQSEEKLKLVVSEFLIAGPMPSITTAAAMAQFCGQTVRRWHSH